MVKGGSVAAILQNLLLALVNVDTNLRTLGAIALGTLALIAGKALMTGLLALTLATIVGLKSLAGGGGSHKSTTYEIIAKPVYSHGETEEISHPHTGFSGGWKRSQRIELPEYFAHEGH